MAVNKTTRTIPKGELRAKVKLDSLDEATRTVELVWTTGYKGLRNEWGQKFYEELSLDDAHIDLSRLHSGAPLLAMHNSESLDAVIGVIESERAEDGKRVAVVRFAEDEYSERIYQKVKSKILRNVSVGYSVEQFTEVTPPGEEIPTFRATRWTPHELSIVSIGFDPNAQTRNFNTASENEVEIIHREIEMQDENQDSPVVLSEEAPLATASVPAAEAVIEAPSVDIEALERKARESEKSRQLEIRSAVSAASLHNELAEQLITEDVPVANAHKRIFEKLEEKNKKEVPPVSNTLKIEVGLEDVEKKRAGFEGALLHRVDSLFKIDEASRQFAGQSALRMIEGLIGRKPFETDSQLAKRAMSTSDFPMILANVASKAAQSRYELQPRTFSLWTKSKTLRDFKEHSQVRAGDFSSLQERNENGEYKMGKIGEEQEKITLRSWGVVHSFTERSLINDDLGLLSLVASQAGVAVSRLENELAYSALLTNKIMNDGTALYHANHGNLSTASVINEAAFSDAFKRMRKQTSVDGKDKLNLTPKYLIVGPDKETEAKKFLATIIPNQTSNVNIFSNSVQLIVDAEIEGNQFYFAADQAQVDTVNMYRREGHESPRVESRINWNTDAIELKVAHDVAAGPMDHRGLVKNPGA